MFFPSTLFAQKHDFSETRRFFHRFSGNPMRNFDFNPDFSTVILLTDCFYRHFSKNRNFCIFRKSKVVSTEFSTILPIFARAGRCIRGHHPTDSRADSRTAKKFPSFSYADSLIIYNFTC